MRAKEERVLRVLLSLEKDYQTVSPTMISNSLGYINCSKIIRERKSLVERGFVEYNGDKHKRATLKLTLSGRVVAQNLPDIVALSPDTKVTGKLGRDTTRLHPKDPGLASPDRIEQLVSDKTMKRLYAGRRYGVAKKPKEKNDV